MAGSSPSVHGPEDIPEAPDGWIGGDLVNTGGNLFARMWIHPEKELRVGYAVDDPDSVGVERVRLEGEDQSNPLSWVHVDNLEGETCDGEQDCLETAIRTMSASDLDCR
ncbi:hypothetical protein [Halolamina litorea]|uniref:Uncharacterized protein n=1 Tax=Halolamina litorea TaxID=1515593 RepID=A0ABD6BM25_9EURY|nr:hypothetical protein [Halolamina litorea]